MALDQCVLHNVVLEETHKPDNIVCSLCVFSIINFVYLYTITLPFQTRNLYLLCICMHVIM